MKKLQHISFALSVQILFLTSSVCQIVDTQTVFFPNQNFPPRVLQMRPNTFIPFINRNAQQFGRTLSQGTNLNEQFSSSLNRQIPNRQIPASFLIRPTGIFPTRSTMRFPSQGAVSIRSNAQQNTASVQQSTTLKAVAVLSGLGSDVTGIITFTQRLPSRNVHVTGILNNLLPGEHGFHVHELGDTSGGCGSTGPHFNPYNTNHGDRFDATRHVGDLGNINVGRDGRAEVNLIDNRIQLTGLENIIGRALVVHAGRDDLGRINNEGSRTTGNAGARLACGVIGIAREVVNG